MISSIEGTLAAVRESSVVVEAGGFGLEVHVPAPAAAALGSIGDDVRLSTYLHVREDALILFGFGSEYDRAVFIALLGVSGVGPKAALAMLSTGGAADVASMIRREDVRGLVKIPGIGKKTAERIVVELKDRIELERGEEDRAAPSPRTETLEEALAALMSLGLTRSNAEKALDRIQPGGGTSGLTVEEIVKMALRKVPL